MAEERLIVGLGNPGKRYEYTRHNLGFLVLKRFAEQEGLKWQTHDFCQAAYWEGKIEDRESFLLLPHTFMNNSGVAVRHVVKEKGFNLQDVLVVCDDFNIELGQMRLRKDGSAGGHNGLNSIIHHLGSKSFARLRVGIGQKKLAQSGKDVSSFSGDNVVEFVLKNFSAREKEKLNRIINVAADCCRAWLTQDVNKVMGMFNNRME